MELDLKLIDNVAIGVCRRTKSFNILEDMKSEIALALLEDKIKSSVQEMTNFAWAYYRQEINNRRVFIDLDIGVYSHKERFDDAYNKNKMYYNLKYVESVYKLHAIGKTYKEVGIILGISGPYAMQHVLRTLHLPIVSTYLKNKAVQASGENAKKNWALLPTRGGNLYLNGCKNPKTKLNKSKVLKMRKLHKVNGVSIRNIAKMPEFNVCPTSAYTSIIGKTWKHI